MSGEILQEKFNKFLVYIKLIKAHINDILVLNKGIFAGHVEELRFFLTHPQGRFENKFQEVQLCIKVYSLYWM